MLVVEAPNKNMTFSTCSSKVAHTKSSPRSKCNMRFIERWGIGLRKIKDKRHYMLTFWSNDSWRLRRHIEGQANVRNIWNLTQIRNPAIVSSELVVQSRKYWRQVAQDVSKAVNLPKNYSSISRNWIDYDVSLSHSIFTVEDSEY